MRKPFSSHPIQTKKVIFLASSTTLIKKLDEISFRSNASGKNPSPV
jgi:hypothetical protein